jgi:hypothetical protein
MVSGYLCKKSDTILYGVDIYEMKGRKESLYSKYDEEYWASIYEMCETKNGLANHHCPDFQNELPSLVRNI